MNFLSPLTFFWMASIFAFIFYKCKKIKAAQFFVFLGFFELFVFSVTPIPALMVNNLEMKYYSKKPIIAGVDAILILGGGHVNDERILPLNQLSTSALSRLVQGFYLYKNVPNCQLICSGCSKLNEIPIATAMVESAVALGVKPKDTIRLTKPVNTWEEAMAYKERFGTAKPFYLVTSAIHMPRAMETFLRFGLQPIPIQADYKVKEDEDKSVYSWRPSWSKIMLTESAFHEFAGIVYYRYFKEVN